MKIYLLLFGLCLFSVKKTISQTSEKADTIATIICECIENKAEENLKENFKKEITECEKGAILGALLSRIPKDEDATITLNSDGSSDEITSKDRDDAYKLLDKRCGVYKTYNDLNNSYTQAFIQTVDTSCQCISKISYDLPLEEKNKLMQECTIEAISKIESKNLTNLVTVEEINSFHKRVSDELVENCEAVSKLSFSSNEEKLYAYSGDKKAMDFYNKGMDAYANKDLNLAVKMYEKAVKQDEKFAYAWDNLGRTYRELNDYDKAINAYEKSIAIDSLNRTPLMNIAVAYNYKKDFDKSTYWYNRIIEISPEDPEGYYGLSLSQMNQNDLEASLYSIIKAHKLYKTSNSPYTADAEKVMAYLYSLFEKENKIKIFEDICNENNIKLD